MSWTLISSTLMTLLLVTGVLLMFIVLLQRGRGGGLAGAFGGLGGQSAFGTKAGDVFTKITIVVAIIWVLLAAFAGLAMRQVNLLHGSTKKPPENPQMGTGADEDGDTSKEDNKVPAEDPDPFGALPPVKSDPKNDDPTPPAENDPDKPVDAVDPKPTDDAPKPTEPKPTEPKPTEPKPTEPKPTDAKPTDAKPADQPAPNDATGTETKPKAPDEESPTPDEPKPPAESKPPADEAPGDATPE
jgi:preprotein translocase subunit SecG